MYMYKRLLDIYFLGQDVMSSKLLKVHFLLKKFKTVNGITWSIPHHPNSLEELAVDLLDKHTHSLV